MIASLPDVLLECDGVIFDDPLDPLILLCGACSASILNGTTPALLLANHMLLGNILEELKDLTIVEEALIAKCRAKCCILHLKEENPDLALPVNQRGLKGHVIIYPQEPSALQNVLPPLLDDICAHFCVIFVGSTEPTKEWLNKNAKPLLVRAHKVRAALIWLKQNNPLYFDVAIDKSKF
jgi:hypothetical protein